MRKDRRQRNEAWSADIFTELANRGSLYGAMSRRSFPAGEPRLSMLVAPFRLRACTRCNAARGAGCASCREACRPLNEFAALVEPFRLKSMFDRHGTTGRRLNRVADGIRLLLWQVGLTLRVDHVRGLEHAPTLAARDRLVVRNLQRPTIGASAISGFAAALVDGCNQLEAGPPLRDEVTLDLFARWPGAIQPQSGRYLGTRAQRARSNLCRCGGTFRSACPPPPPSAAASRRRAEECTYRLDSAKVRLLR
jgi:hypothetical protein